MNNNEEVLEQKKSRNLETIATVSEITQQLCSGKYERVRHDVIRALTDKKVPMNKETKPTYQSFVFSVCTVAKNVKNTDLLKRTREFAKTHNLDWN